MAAVANTVLTTQAVGNREELDDFVSMITPTDTPIYSMAGKEKASSKHPEWEYEDLDAPADNAQPEGNEYNFDAVTPPTRVGNYTQIFTKTFRFSGTQQAVDNAGNAEKRAHELISGTRSRLRVPPWTVSPSSRAASRPHPEPVEGRGRATILYSRNFLTT